MHVLRLTVAAAVLLSLGACTSDDDFVPLDTSSKSASTEPTETASPEPESSTANPQKSTARLIRELTAYADQSNTRLGKVVIDSIDASPRGFSVRLSSTFAEFGLEQAQSLVEQWNREIVGMLADAGRSADDGSVRYYLGGQLVAQNKVSTDPWAVGFAGILDR